MTKKEITIISEVVSKIVIESLIPVIKKLIKEEHNKLLLDNKNVKKPTIKKKNNYLDSISYVDAYKEILEATKPKIEIPSTGNNLLDNILNETPTEKELLEKAQNRQIKSNQFDRPIPIEELYLNDVKNVTAEMAENVDYTAFMKQMESRRSGIDNSALLMGGVSNTKALYVKDKNSIVQEQSIGVPKVEKTMKLQQ